MAPSSITLARAQKLLSPGQVPILVLGDVMLDHFIWGSVTRISPEAPVPVVDVRQESLMPGGAGNVARNVASLASPVTIMAAVGRDLPGRQLSNLLREHGVSCEGIVADKRFDTSVKTRVVAHQQQVVRIDREKRGPLAPSIARKLVEQIHELVPTCGGVIVADYAKGVVQQELLDVLKKVCREHGVWLSMDPKPAHKLDLNGLSLLTPNRKEAFELAGIADGHRGLDPLRDEHLLDAARRLMADYKPAILLVTLGEQGMLLCQREQAPLHIPTVAQEVFDVSGAGDTVIATFTVAITRGATPMEAAVLSNHAAGIVVGKVGTAHVTPEELLGALQGKPREK